MAGDMDIEQHRDTYGSIMSLMKWGALACAIIAAIVIWLIA